MAGCVVAHIGIFLSVILWIPVVNSSFGSRHPFLSVLIFFIMFAVMRAFLFPNFLNSVADNDKEKADYVSTQITKGVE